MYISILIVKEQHGWVWHHCLVLEPGISNTIVIGQVKWQSDQLNSMPFKMCGLASRIDLLEGKVSVPIEEVEELVSAGGFRGPRRCSNGHPTLCQIVQHDGNFGKWLYFFTSLVQHLWAVCVEIIKGTKNDALPENSKNSVHAWIPFHMKW